MKMTKREKKMLIGLGVLVLCAVYFQFLVTPQLETIRQLDEQLAALTTKVQLVKQEHSPNSSFNKDYKILHTKTAAVTQPFLSEIQQEKLILLLDDLIGQSELKPLTIAFSDIELSEIKDATQEEMKVNPLKQLVDQYKTPENQANTQKETKTPSEVLKAEEDLPMVDKMSSTIAFQGSYGKLLQFMKGLEEQEKRFSIKSIAISKGEDDSFLGTILIDFYGLPKLFPNKDDNMAWEFDNSYGKDNPFDPFSGYSYGNIEQTATEQAIAKLTYDFFLSVRPISSDLPTIMMGDLSDKTLDSYVYADNQNYEEVVFQLIQEGDQYFYKYKTQTDSYPSDYEGDRIAFDPRGSTVNMRITSFERNSDTDLSGVNLTVLNQTDLKLNIVIEYEDTDKPRVNIVKKLGRVEVK